MTDEETLKALQNAESTIKALQGNAQELGRLLASRDEAIIELRQEHERLRAFVDEQKSFALEEKVRTIALMAASVAASGNLACKMHYKNAVDHAYALYRQAQHDVLKNEEKDHVDGAGKEGEKGPTS